MTNDYEATTCVEDLDLKVPGIQLQRGVNMLGDRKIGILDNLSSDLFNFSTIVGFIERMPKLSRYEMLLTLKAYAEDELKERKKEENHEPR